MLKPMLGEISKSRFRQYLVGFTRNIKSSFTNTITWPYLLLHILAIILTIPLVTAGIDWYYFVFFRDASYLQPLLFPAVMIGGLVPFFLPPLFYLYGKFRDRPNLEPLSFALTQSAVVGLFWSALYKAFTGRIGPEFDEFTHQVSDYSMDFYFGFLLGGVFDGWPSGHTTIAWALAITFYLYRPQNQDVAENKDNDFVTVLLNNRWIGIVYALYVGFGVSTNIHWLSDAIAGTLIGITVGRSTAKNYIWNEQVKDTVRRANMDQTVKSTFFILGLIILFSILIPRELLGL